MSLRAFHILFVIASIVLAAGFGAWSLRSYGDAHERTDLIFGVASLAVALALVVYGVAVFKKLRRVSKL